jgi:hypothetical protein
MFRYPLWVAFCLFLLAPLSTAQVGRVGRTPAPLAEPEAEVHPPLLRFDGPGVFSRLSVGFAFDSLDDGQRLEQQLGPYGMRVRLGDGAAPSVWEDLRARCFPPRGRRALSNGSLEELRTATHGSIEDEDEGSALVITFAAQVNRVGFELRRVDPGELNVVVRVLSRGVEIGQLFFDVGQRFGYVGVQCAEPFDEVRVDFTNPASGLFSVDNIRQEYDLADADRDGWPDFADPCPDVPGNVVDSDGDGRGDPCDAYPLDSENDADEDGIGAELDNCPTSYNPDQRDADGDGLGDACDDFPFGSDTDNDGVGDTSDNCPTTFNPEQADCDLDGIGDVCDDALVSPAEVSFLLAPGECVTVTKTICLPPAPPVVDVVIAFDTTGSMGGEILALRQNVAAFVNGVRQQLPLSNIRFALVAIKDYPAFYTSCGYAAQYSLPTDTPFEVLAPIGTSDAQFLQIVNALTARGGQDQPEAYARALWEITQPDSGIGFRQGAARFVLLVGDAPPHDCNVGAGIPACLPSVSLGRDPGRDGLLFTPDDVDLQTDALVGLIQANTPVLMLFSGLVGHCAWQQWCQATGGDAIRASTSGVLPPGTDLVGELVDIIRDPIVNQVTYAADNPCGLDVTFDPPFVQGPIDVSLGAQVSFTETICAPAELPPGTDSLDCEVRITADGVLLGVQRIHIDLGCELFTLDFETEDDFETPLVNGQTISTPPEFGRLVHISTNGANLGAAIFDSTPGGPNDPSVNDDMLVGHGNMLVLQDSSRPQQSPSGFFTTVTDDPDGGEFVFDFLDPVDPKSILLADINPPPNRGAIVTLIDTGNLARTYFVEPGWTGTYGDAGPWRLDLTTVLPQPGNGTPRFARAQEVDGFRQDQVLRIVVQMTGYGAIDELVFCK